MKTQISRWTDEPAKRRGGIYQQQDRMLIDSDLNALLELLKQRVDDALGEVVGTGAPQSDTVGVITDGPLIRRAVISVDGIRSRFDSATPGTEPFALTEQADFPSPPPYLGGEQVIYADVWEWPLTALEDPSMLDPGLHGSDTTTRTQTLAQVKWCPAVIDPLQSPAQGNALLTLAVREGGVIVDRCDPCAGAIATQKRVGNYLFRVEVHDVAGAPDAPTEITLKWSAENSATQHARTTVPDTFTRGEWIYELFSEPANRHLGVHLVPGFTPRRGLLIDRYPATATVPELKERPLVRRWDGYAVLVRNDSSWSIKSVDGVLQAKDKGRTPAAVYTAPSILLELSGLSLTLTLGGRKFVAGDYWLSVVREDEEGERRIQPASSAPIGITHHYAVLARVNGATVQPLSDADKRRWSFPRLTDLNADRIGYNPESQAARWTDVIDDGAIAAPPNVQRAIDLLVERLESSDIRLQIPECSTSPAPTVRSLLNFVAGNSEKTDGVLRALLCELKATKLPLDKNAPGLPPIFNVPHINTVQQALTLLGAAAVSGCEMTVGSGGRYATLAEALADLAAAEDISLCLLPGQQSLPSGAVVTGKRTIKLTGVGGYASKINLGAFLQLGAREIILKDIALVSSQAASRVSLQADRVVAQNSGFARAVTWSSYRWARPAGNSGEDAGTCVVVDKNRRVIVAGHFQGEINFTTDSSKKLVSAGGTPDIFLAVFDAEGNYVWGKPFGAGGLDKGLALGVDAQNNILLAGYFQGTVDFGTNGTKVLQSQGSMDLFVAKFDPAGVHIWSNRYGALGDDEVFGLAVDAANNIIITGQYQLTFTFGGTSGNLPGAGESFNIFIAKLDPNGNTLWAKGYGGVLVDKGVSVGVDGGGNVLFTGFFNDTVNFGGETFSTNDGSSIFHVKLSPSGAHIWSRPYGAVGSAESASIAVDVAGHSILTGYSTGTINFGGEDLRLDHNVPLYLARFDSARQHVWSRRFPGTGDARGLSVAFEANGNVVLTGFFTGTVNFGGANLASASVNGNDLFVARFDAAGNHLSSSRYGGSGSDKGLSTAVDVNGDILLAGAFQGPLDFGGGLLTGAGASDIFVVKLTPEPVLDPFVTVRPRDPSHGVDLVWSENDMLVSVADSDGIRQPRTALALATPSIGGAIVDNTIFGRLLLLSDLPVDVTDPVNVAQGVTSVGGGAYLTIQGNHIGRISSRYETGAPNLDAFGSLNVTANTITEPSSSLIAESISLSKNRFVTRLSTDEVGVAAARRMMIIGNQAVHPQARLRITLSSFQEAGNLLLISRLEYPSFQPYPADVWYFGGVGADLL